jgi:hypothetical protein
MKQCYPPQHMQTLSTPRRSKRLTIATCALFLATATFAQKPKIKEVHASSDHPVWRVDLQSQGFPPNSSDLQRRRGFANFDTISFLSDSVLAATFVTREDIPDLQRREDPNHLRPYRLHAIFLDALTGKTLRTLAWPVENPNAGIFPRPDGGFLLLTTEKIVSYSPGWNPLKELPLSDLHPTSSATLGAIAESPSYNSLVIQFLNGNFAHCLNVRTGTLDFSPIACGTLDVFTASDNGILAPEKLPGGKELRESGPTGAFIQYGVAMPDAPPESTVRVLNPDQARTAHTICSPCVGIPQFINNEILAMYSPTYMSIMDRAGKIRFTQDFSPTVEWIDELGRPVRPSANGLRVAIASNKSDFSTASPFTGGNANTDQANPNASGNEQRAEAIKARARAGRATAVHMSTGDIPAEFPSDVQVYDLTAAQWIYTLEIKAEHLRQIWGLALSPNGNNLAIDSGGTIQIFALPK